LAAKKRAYYKAKPKAEIDPSVYGLNAMDAARLRAYYHKMLLLEPDCVAEIILELGLPEMPTF
jgi:hypothetical protein